jgi:nucleoside-diphosphate-sugar epimerase
VKLLVTGNTGFIGGNLTRYLANNNYENFTFLGRTSTPNWHTIDNLINCRGVIHLTGLAHDTNKVFDYNDYLQANYILTKKIFDLFLQSDNAQVFIFVSTVAVRNKHSGVFYEDDTPNPQTHYGKSKRLAEEYILANLPQNKRVYILRPCMVHGQGNKGNLSLLYSFINKGIPYPLGAFDNKRSLLSIDSLCFVIKELIERDDIPSGIYHLADDEPISTQNIIKLIGNVTEKKISIWNIPPVIIKTLAKLGDILPLPINTERLEKMTENYIVSNQKIKKALGKEFPLTSLEGLRKTITSFDK